MYRNSKISPQTISPWDFLWSILSPNEYQEKFGILSCYCFNIYVFISLASTCTDFFSWISNECCITDFKRKIKLPFELWILLHGPFSSQLPSAHFSTKSGNFLLIAIHDITLRFFSYLQIFPLNPLFFFILLTLKFFYIFNPFFSIWRDLPEFINFNNVILTAPSIWTWLWTLRMQVSPIQHIQH